MNLIIPTISKDFNNTFNNYKLYKKYIEDINKLVFIGDEEVEKLIIENLFNFNIPVEFINEKKLIDINKIKKLIKNRNKNANRRVGWYVQNFLKMQYSKICKDKYYLIWDSDTIPVKKVKMFNNVNKPFFDLKTEYHEPYFITMNRVIPKLKKKINKSFISEHMLIKSELMLDLINRIENNTNVPGDSWYEKIINVIDIKDLPHSGFSEFETYGTFVLEYYKEVYDLREWKSIRWNQKIYNPKNLTESDIQNIAKQYDAISFEL